MDGHLIAFRSARTRFRLAFIAVTDASSYGIASTGRRVIITPNLGTNIISKHAAAEKHGENG